MAHLLGGEDARIWFARNDGVDHRSRHHPSALRGEKVPELARGLGSGVREFRAGTKEGQIEDKKKEEEKTDEEDLAADDATVAEEEKDASVKAEQKRG